MIVKHNIESNKTLGAKRTNKVIGQVHTIQVLIDFAKTPLIQGHSIYLDKLINNSIQGRNIYKIGVRNESISADLSIEKVSLSIKEIDSIDLGDTSIDNAKFSNNFFARLAKNTVNTIEKDISLLPLSLSNVLEHGENIVLSNRDTVDINSGKVLITIYINI